MAAPIKDKLQGFVYGLLLGLLIGCGFFIFKLDGYFRDINFYKKNASRTEVIDQSNDNKATNSVVPPKKNLKTNPDSVQVAIVNFNKYVRLDTLGNLDSLMAATDALVGGQTDEMIIVKKDELLSTKKFELVNLTNNSSVTNDSLMEKVSGVRNDKEVSNYTIEFWQSPVNFKGYKMTKNKIVLFGLTEADVIKIYKTDEAYFLKTSQAIYRLNFSNEHRAFEKVNDEGLLVKMK